MQILALNHVGLNVLDLERSRRFYAEVLGLDELPRPNFDFPGAWFRLGIGQELHLIGKRASGDGRFKESHFSLQVGNAARAAARLARSGIAFDGPRARPDGAQQINLRDPDGHALELIELAGDAQP